MSETEAVSEEEVKEVVSEESSEAPTEAVEESTEAAEESAESSEAAVEASKEVSTQTKKPAQEKWGIAHIYSSYMVTTRTNCCSFCTGGISYVDDCIVVAAVDMCNSPFFLRWFLGLC